MLHPPDGPTPLTPEQSRILRAQSIGTDGPGTIGRDFEAMLRFVSEREVPVSGVHLLLPHLMLSALNQEMARPLDIRLKRPQLKSFANLNGLYLLLRALGLSHIEATGHKRLLRLDKEALAAWHELNPTEKYFTLLETWLARADEGIIGEYHGILSPLYRCVSFLRHLPPEGLTIAGTPEEERLRYYPSLHNTALLEAFGLLSIEHAQSLPGKGWRIERVSHTPLGQAVFALLLGPDSPLWKHGGGSGSLERLLDFGPPIVIEDSEDEEGEGEALQEIAEPPFGQMQPLFAPFFPEWRRNLALPEPPRAESNLVFKISLGRAWRRISIPSRLMLNDLSDAILSAFGFDDDHLYLFSYRNRFGATVEVNHPFTREPPTTNRVTVGSLGLREGDAMDYLFDFGDEWEFDVLLERIEAPNPRQKKPHLLEEHGLAPAQYGEPDEH